MQLHQQIDDNAAVNIRGEDSKGNLKKNIWFKKTKMGYFLQRLGDTYLLSLLHFTLLSMRVLSQGQEKQQLEQLKLTLKSWEYLIKAAVGVCFLP